MPSVDPTSDSKGGYLRIADDVARRARQTVAAYRDYLGRQGVADGVPFESLPSTDKENYLKKFPFRDLIGDDFDETFTIFSSSGSSGHAFYWPQLKSQHSAAAASLRTLLESVFDIHERRTLAVVGLALGSWIGGDQFSWALKNVSIATPYPFAVFSPGNKHEEIISIVHSAAGMVDQFLLVCCPSAIGHLLLLAEQTGRPMPLEKMCFLVIGEPFPEALRFELEQRSAADGRRPCRMISVYGSADTGVLGFESPWSVFVRRQCEENRDFAAAVGCQGPAPHFFHVADHEAYLEVVNGELHVTKWQGIPLVRYNLHDAARLMDSTDLAPAVARVPNRSAREMLENPPIPGRLLAISGRADSCLILCGTNLTETMLDHALRSPELQDVLTGAYKARTILERGRQRLEIVAETHGGPRSADSIYDGVIAALGRAQPEFLDDWNSIYRQWDADRDRRILKLILVPWPELSGSDSGVKHRGVVR